MTKVILFLAMMLMLFGSSFVLEGRLRGCAMSGLVSASAGQKSVTLLAVNYRPGRTYYHLATRESC